MIYPTCRIMPQTDTGGVRVSKRRSPLIGHYIIMFVTAFGALFGAPFWAALLGGTVLALIEVVEQDKLRSRFAAIGASDVLATAHLSALAVGWLAGTAAWCLGRFSLWAFWS